MNVDYNPDDPLSGPLRPASDSDHIIDVDGVGKMRIAKRQMIDHIRINVVYSLLTQSVVPTPFLDTLSTWLATLRVLAVELPSGFGTLNRLDPLDDKTYKALQKVSEALRVTEESFRQGPATNGAPAGAGAVHDPQVLVSPAVQPNPS